MHSNGLILLNVICFQLLWLACVFSVGYGLSLPVLIVVVLFTAVHLHWLENWQQALPLLITAAVGSLFDQVGYSMGWISFNHHQSWTSHIPLWMIALWLAFSCTLNVSLRWLQCKPLLATVLGGIFGPLAYLAAAQLGAVSLPLPYSLGWVALEWAIAMPLLLWIRYAFNQTVEIRHT